MRRSRSGFEARFACLLSAVWALPLLHNEAPQASDETAGVTSVRRRDGRMRVQFLGARAEVDVARLRNITNPGCKEEAASEAQVAVRGPGRSKRWNLR